MPSPLSERPSSVPEAGIPSPAEGRSNVPARGPWLLVVVVALGLLPTFLFQHRAGDPLGSDARLLTHQNRYMQDADGLRAVWTRDFFEGAETGQVTYRSGYYRPVTNTFLWVVHRAAGENARGYNVVQTLLHGWSSVLAALVLLLLSAPVGARAEEAAGKGGRERLAAAAAVGLLFAVHPIQAFAATEPAAVADVLFPALFLLAMATFELALATDSRRRRVAAVGATAVLYALATLSKEMGITLPAVLVLQVLRRWARGETSLGTLRWTLPAWGVLLAYAAWRFGVLDLPMHANRYAAEHGWGAVLAAGPKSLLIHVSRALVPLSPGHPELNPTLLNRLQSPWTDPLAWAGVLVTAAFATAAVMWRRRPDVAFWAAFTLVTFSPLLLVERIGRGLAPDVILTQERWFYLPFLGIVAIAIHALVTAWQAAAGRRRWAVTGLAVAAVVALAQTARIHAGKHDDPFAQLRTLYLFPEEELSRQELANRLLLYAHFVAVPRGDTADALGRAERAVRLTPDSPLSAASFATLLALQDRWPDVRVLLEPWYRPSPEVLAAAAVTHPRVYDDLNRSGPRLTLLLGRALIRETDPTRGVRLVCEASRAGAPEAEVRQALSEASSAGLEHARCTTPSPESG